jgi:hypothetical protein
MIYSRFGGTVRIVRLATEADHRACGETPIRKADRQRIADNCRVVFRFDGDGAPENPRDDGKDRVADVSYLRADNGWKEMSDAIAAIVLA